MKKTAVIYWSGTGNTKQMAEAVAEGMKSAGAEAGVLEPAQVDGSTFSGVDAVASASYSTVEGMPSGAFAHWRTLFKTMWAVTFSPSARWRLTRWASTR